MTIAAMMLCLLLLIWCIELVGYVLLLPEPAPPPVQEHGWLKQRLGMAPAGPEPHPLYSDDEVLAELQPGLAAGSLPSTLTIAEYYVYPQKYVEEVLLPRLIQQHMMIFCATMQGSS